MAQHSFRGWLRKNFPCFCSSLDLGIRTGPNSKRSPLYWEVFYTTLPPFYMWPRGGHGRCWQRGERGRTSCEEMLLSWKKKRKENAHWNFATFSLPVLNLSSWTLQLLTITFYNHSYTMMENIKSYYGAMGFFLERDTECFNLLWKCRWLSFEPWRRNCQ